MSAAIVYNIGKSGLEVVKDGEDPYKQWRKSDAKLKTYGKKKRKKNKQVQPKIESNPKPKRNKKPIQNSNNFYKSHAWAKLRYEALKDSDGRCELCGRGKSDGAVLQVDHIKPISKHPELALSLDNTQVLCSTCNWGKYAYDETDWKSRNKDWVGLTPIKDL